MESTVSEIATPGGMVSHSATPMYWRPSANMTPQLGKRRHAHAEEAQRRLRHDVAGHREARDNDDRAPDIGQQMLEDNFPIALSDRPRGRTNSSCLIESTWPRTIRPYCTQPVRPSTIMILSRPGPSTAMIARASRMVGKDNWISARRMMTSSAQPPKNPEISPEQNADGA